MQRPGSIATLHIGSAGANSAALRSISAVSRSSASAGISVDAPTEIGDGVPLAVGLAVGGLVGIGAETSEKPIAAKIPKLTNQAGAIGVEA